MRTTRGPPSPSERGSSTCLRRDVKTGPSPVGVRSAADWGLLPIERAHPCWRPGDVPTVPSLISARAAEGSALPRPAAPVAPRPEERRASMVDSIVLAEGMSIPQAGRPHPAHGPRVREPRAFAAPRGSGYPNARDNRPDARRGIPTVSAFHYQGNLSMSRSTEMARLWSPWHDWAHRALERQPSGRRVLGAPARALAEGTRNRGLRGYVRCLPALPQQLGSFPTHAGLKVRHGRSFAVTRRAPELRLGRSDAAS
jgi:hypothetical protein